MSTSKAIFSLLDQNIIPKRAAAMLGISEEEVLGAILYARRKDWGRPELFPFIVACRSRDWPDWSNEDEKVMVELRIKHDAGEVSLMQWVGDTRIVQYSFPEKEPVKRYPWFTAVNDY